MTILLLMSMWLSNVAAMIDPGASGPVESLTIETAAGVKHEFKVEVVKDDLARDRGLMFRQSLPTDGGMLFVYDPPQSIAFWMKNTFIPLDIIFIDANGVILNIAANTTPLSLVQLQSSGAARGILEINADTTARFGIKAGDHVRHRIFPDAPR